MRWATLCALVASTAGLIGGLKLARADRDSEQGNPRQLVLSEPGNASHWSRLGQPAQALVRNPYRGSDWVAWAAAEETAGNSVHAERLLQRAFEHDRTFLTRWALANFYFRQSRPTEFWMWLAAAAEFSYGDASALFKLAERMEPRPSVVLQRAFRRSSALLPQYLAYLRRAGRQEEALPVAETMAQLSDPLLTGQLLAYTTDLLVEGHGAAASRMWSALHRSSQITYPSFTRGSLCNSHFEQEPLNAGFDWITHPRRGHIDAGRGPKGWRMEFLNADRRDGELLSQFMLCEPGHVYEVDIVESREGVPPNTSLLWTVRTYPDRTSISEAIAPGRLRFRAPPHDAVLRLVLRYEPGPGTVRPRGVLTVLSAALRELPELGREPPRTVLR